MGLCVGLLKHRNERAMKTYVLRDIDPAFWRQVKAQAAERNQSVKAVINQLLKDWLPQAKKDNP